MALEEVVCREQAVGLSEVAVCQQRFILDCSLWRAGGESGRIFPAPILGRER